MTTIQPIKAGITVAIILGGLHFVWSILVLLGWAQPLVEFSMWAHMVQMPVTIGPFDLVAAVTVICIASCIGFAVGVVFSKVWNKVHK